MAETCDGVKSQYIPWQMEYRNCQPFLAWTPTQSQGQGGQIVQGALTGIGLGVLGQLMSPTTASATTTTVLQSAPGGKH
jgi:hypothetical protein